jgi:hypothetical protein
MTAARRLLGWAAAVLVVSLTCAFTGTSAQPDVTVIVTAAATYEPLAALRGADRFPDGAQLQIVQHGVARLLAPGFAATADASVSFDAKHVLIAAKKNAGDAWAIWELSVADGAVRKVLGSDSDLIRPLYLPADRLVYAHRTAQGFRLETARMDGSDVKALGFVRGSAVPDDVLADGRILFESQFPLGSAAVGNGASELYLAYSDGSGVEAYRCDHGSARWAARQIANGDVVFTKGAQLARFTSALAEENQIAAPAAEYAGGVTDATTSGWILSAREGSAGRFELMRWRPGAATLKPLLRSAERDIVQPVLLAPRNRPKMHPSALHDWSYANMLALDVRQSREGDLKAAPAQVRLETQDSEGHEVVLGTSPVEADGSFFVKVPADAPLRFALLDASGSVVRQELGWFWIRKGEQRICVGCHAGPERASENRVPAVLLRSTNAVDLTQPQEHAAESVQGSR